MLPAAVSRVLLLRILPVEVPRMSPPELLTVVVPIGLSIKPLRITAPAPSLTMLMAVGAYIVDDVERVLVGAVLDVTVGTPWH